MRYDANDYPETMRLLGNSIVVGSDAHPLYAQDAELRAYYAHAFRKVFGQIEAVVRGSG